MNICTNCSHEELSELSVEDELHFSDEFETESESEATSETVSLCWSPKKIKDKGKQPVSMPKLNSFCPCQKNVGPSSSMPMPECDVEAENNLLNKMVKTNNLLYIPVSVQVRNSWINVHSLIPKAPTI